MKQIKSYGKRILTLTAESANINHVEQFRDSRRGNQELNKRSKLFVAIQKHNRKLIRVEKVKGKKTLRYYTNNPLTVTITKSI